MGLLFNMSVYDLGYIRNTQGITLYPNYAEGCRVFCDTFLAEAQARCPVRTGYLRSTISASSTASSVTCMVGADYAQYVEYGTSRQLPQRYFEPALWIAWERAKEYWDRAERKVIAKQRQLVQQGYKLQTRVDNFYQDAVNICGGFGWSDFVLMTLSGFIYLLAQALMEEFKKIFNGTEKEQLPSNHSSGWSSLASFISVF